MTDAAERATTLHRQGRVAEAVDAYREALAAQPRAPGLLVNLGVALSQLGRTGEALAAMSDAAAAAPSFAEAHYGLGVLLQGAGRLPEALDSWRRAVEVRPDHADAWFNLGLALREFGRTEEAVAAYRSALAARPGWAVAWGNLGNACQDLGLLDQALDCQRMAVQLAPAAPVHRHNLGLILQEQGRTDEAITVYREGLKADPDAVRLRFALCLAQLPIIHADPDDVCERRAAYARHLAALRTLFDSRPDDPGWIDAVGTWQPFFLAYQGENDRDLQRQYGTLLADIMGRRFPPASLPAAPAAGEPVRVGVVAGFFRRHSIWKIPVKGWTKLDRTRFRLFAYHTGRQRDEETADAAARFDRFVQGPLSLEAWRAEIAADAPHVLLYPDIGMDPVSVQLAAQRLAPVQCVALGHPDTTGLPTLDYYLSSAAMEPADADQHYTETVVRLPNLSVVYEPPAIRPVRLARADLGLRDGAVAYWSGQSLFKYPPAHDRVFARIAREVGDCQFVFIHYAKSDRVTGLFRDRLERAFAAEGLRAEDHCLIVPNMSVHGFAAAIGLCDVVLDSLGWSGFNSTLESLRHALPVVTMAGPLMRARHSAAILKVMGLGRAVAHGVDDYVAAAVRFGRDPAARAEMSAAIAAARHRLYDDPVCLTALADFLEAAARGRAAS